VPRKAIEYFAEKESAFLEAFDRTGEGVENRYLPRWKAEVCAELAEQCEGCDIGDHDMRTFDTRLMENESFLSVNGRNRIVAEMIGLVRGSVTVTP
jgi:hypothetical protein